MSVLFLDAMANAIYYNEGHLPQDRNHRNNNPGNLRAFAAIQPQDDGHYRVFDNFIDGYQELRDDIRAKVSGNNTHGLSLDSDLDKLFSVYAPATDNNVPHRYALFVAWWLTATYDKHIDTTMSFRAILQLIGQTLE